MPHTTQPPGWYPDPWYPGSQRWWDGSAWTEHAQATWSTAAPDPATERTWGTRAVVGMWIQGACGAMSAALWPAIAASLDRTSSTGGDAGRALGLLGLVQLLSLGGIAGLILVAIWSNHATHTARHLGCRTKHSPGWAVAAWLVPIVNLWFPYQVVRDLFPQGHPTRSKLGGWWALHFLTSLFFFRLTIGDGSGLAGVTSVLALVSITANLGAAYLGSRIVRSAADEHARALTHVAALAGGPRL